MSSGIKVPQTIIKLRKGMGSPVSFITHNETAIFSSSIFIRGGGVAQWLGRRISDQGVPGSNPGRCTFPCGLKQVTFTLLSTWATIFDISHQSLPGFTPFAMQWPHHYLATAVFNFYIEG